MKKYIDAVQVECWNGEFEEKGYCICPYDVSRFFTVPLSFTPLGRLFHNSLPFFACSSPFLRAHTLLTPSFPPFI